MGTSYSRFVTIRYTYTNEHSRMIQLEDVRRIRVWFPDISKEIDKIVKG